MLTLVSAKRYRLSLDFVEEGYIVQIWSFFGLSFCDGDVVEFGLSRSRHVALQPASA